MNDLRKLEKAKAPRRCKDCGQVKEVQHFYEGCASYCMECKRIRQATWREKNREAHLDYLRRYRERKAS